jgi:hypothetical protein
MASPSGPHGVAGPPPTAGAPPIADPRPEAGHPPAADPPPEAGHPPAADPPPEAGHPPIADPLPVATSADPAGVGRPAGAGGPARAGGPGSHRAGRMAGKRRRWRLAAEAATAGLGAAATACWAGVCLVGSFRPELLGIPYWGGLPHLRSDTTGFFAFVVAAGCLWASEYLRWRRRAATPPTPPGTAAAWSGGRGPLLLLSAAETAAVLGTGLVAYLSVNAVTHPATLGLHVTHLLPWPAEGTLRVLALLVTAVSVAVIRYLWPSRPRAGPRG